MTVLAAYRGRVGEHKPVRIARALGAASLVLGAAVVLTSCSALGAAPGSAASPSDTTVATPVDTAVATPEPTASVAPVETPTPTAAADGRTAVTPFITTADWDASASALDVSAIITGVVEGDGTCTVTVASDSTSKTATAPGVAAGSYTGCQAVAVTGLTPGAWTVTVKYSSAKSVGTSAAKTAQVG